MRILRRGGLLCTEVEEGQRLRTEGGCDENLEKRRTENLLCLPGNNGPSVRVSPPVCTCK